MKEAVWVLRSMKYSLLPRRYFLKRRENVKSWQRFWKSYYQYKKMASENQQPLIKHLYPCLGDDTAQTEIEPVYFYQDTWAFGEIIKVSPSHHVDVGSHHKFVAFLSKVLPVTMIDIRPLSLPLETLEFKEGSILKLPFPDKSVESLSSLCVVEHIGLGRYGGPLDASGSEKAIAELCRVMRPNGHLYVSVPIDDHNRLFFNAHRAFKEQYFEALLSPLRIVDRRYIVGKQLLAQKPTGFSIALYHAIKSEKY